MERCAVSLLLTTSFVLPRPEGELEWSFEGTSGFRMAQETIRVRVRRMGGSVAIGIAVVIDGQVLYWHPSVAPAAVLEFPIDVRGLGQGEHGIHVSAEPSGGEPPPSDPKFRVHAGAQTVTLLSPDEADACELVEMKGVARSGTNWADWTVFQLVAAAFGGRAGCTVERPRRVQPRATRTIPLTRASKSHTLAVIRNVSTTICMCSERAICRSILRGLPVLLHGLARAYARMLASSLAC